MKALLLLSLGPPTGSATPTRWADQRRQTIAAQGGRCARCKARPRRKDGAPALDVVTLPDGKRVAFCRSHRLMHDAPERIPRAVWSRAHGAKQEALTFDGVARKPKGRGFVAELRREALVELGPGASAAPAWIRGVPSWEIVAAHQRAHPATEASCWPACEWAGGLWLALHEGGTARGQPWPELLLLFAAPLGEMILTEDGAITRAKVPTVVQNYGGDWRRFEGQPWAPLTRFLACGADGVPVPVVARASAEQGADAVLGVLVRRGMLGTGKR